MKLGELLGDSSLPSDTKEQDLLGDWVRRIRGALHETNDEAEMNVILQKALKEIDGVEGLKIEDSAKKLKTEAKHDDDENNRRSSSQVKERHINNLIFDCYGDECYKNLERKNGLPISLKSKPDFAVWAKGGGGMAITGDGKNGEKYTLCDAIRQCASYMLVHMFYWLVTKSKAVESVFGIAFLE